MLEKSQIHLLFVRAFHNPFTAWIVLALSLCVTLLAYTITNSVVNQRAEDRFTFRSQEISKAIVDRLNVYEQALWGAVALMNASSEVTRAEYARYVDTLDINQHWPGIQGMGYSIPLSASELQDHIETIRQQGFSDYTVNPIGDREQYSAIIYLEPFDWRNRRAFGYDMWSNDMRRAAMARARDQGTAATSGIITLVQETDEDVQRGFLTYLPVYRSKDVPSTVKQRREQFQGWVYAPFRMGNLMEGIFDTERNDIEFEIYDGNDMYQQSLLYDSDQQIQSLIPNHQPRFSKILNLNLQGRPWTVYFSTPSDFVVSDNFQPFYIVVAGLIVDILLFYLIYSLYILHRRAESLGNEWRLIIEQAPNALITTKKDGSIVMTNTRAEELFGYQKGELIGQSIEVLIPDNIKSSHPQKRENFLRAPKARDMGAGRDLRGKRKDGTEVRVEIGLNPLRTRQGIFVVAAVVDITERLNNQAELQNANDLLLTKNQEMEQFIYTVSHDLKAPLVTIGGFTSRLKTSLADTLDEKQSHQLQRIANNVEHMEGLLSDLLQLSRVIREDIDKSLINSETLIKSLLNTLESSINKAGGTIHIVRPLADVYGNERMLFQCLQNLVANALQYPHPDRTIVIDIKIEDQSESTAIIVTDNGMGIEEKYFDRIFRIFERLNVGDGTGVGLAIVKTIAEKHDGRIMVSSTYHEGSTFTLVIPKPIPKAETNLSLQVTC